MLKSPRFWIGIIISLVCLYFSFQGIQFDKVLNALRDFNYLWLIPASIIFLASYVARVFRWQLLFDPLKPRIFKIFHALNIGYFLSNILPARLGDIVRAYLIGSIENVSKAHALSTVVVERLSDGLSAVLLLAISALFVPNIPDIAKQGALATAVAGVGAVVFLIVLSIQKERSLALLHRLTAPIPFLQNPKLWRTLESLIDGFAILRTPRPLIGVAGWALCAWILGGLMYWVFMAAMDLRVGGALLPWHAAFIAMTVVSIAVIVPSSPGYVGVFEFGVQQLLTIIYGVDESVALGYALVVHAFWYLWLIAMGLYSMWHEGLTYQQLQSMNSEN